MQQGYSTLNDIDWAQMKQQQKASRESNFVQDFLLEMRARGKAVNPKLTWNGTNLSFTAPGTKAMNDTDVWNLYVQAAQGEGVKPDVAMFDTQILPYYKQLANEEFQTQLGKLRMQDIPEEEWTKLYRTSSAYKAHLIDSIQNTDNPEDVTALQGFIPPDEGQGLWENIKENPMVYGAGGVVTASAAKFAYDKARASQSAALSGGAKFMKGFAPYLGAMATPYIASALGATEKEADVLGGFANIGAGGYMGYQGATGMRANNLAGNLAGSNNTKTLINRAKALGITEIDGKKIGKIKDANLLQKGIAERVQNDGYRKTKSNLSQNRGSKQIFKNANKKWGGSKILKNAKLGKLPGFGTLALAALTIPEIIALGKTLFGKDAPTSDDVKDYSPYQKPTKETPYARKWGDM